MTIAKVLAVYKTAPMVLVVESAEGTVLELSLADLHGTGHRLSDEACRSLIEAYQLFTCQPVGRRHARRRSR
jgi:hypothetical protein